MPKLPKRVLTSEGLEVLRNLKLSPREIEIVETCMNCPTSREIGEKLFITEKTVKFHFTSIFKKMKVPNRASLVLMVNDLFQVPSALQRLVEDGLPKGRR